MGRVVDSSHYETHTLTTESFIFENECERHAARGARRGIQGG